MFHDWLGAIHSTARGGHDRHAKSNALDFAFHVVIWLTSATILEGFRRNNEIAPTDAFRRYSGRRNIELQFRASDCAGAHD